jgi:hypothetical protein
MGDSWDIRSKVSAIMSPSSPSLVVKWWGLVRCVLPHISLGLRFGGFRASGEKRRLGRYGGY